VILGAGAVALARRRLRGRPARSAIAWALGVAAVLGSAFNDSGLLVGAAVVAVGWPALLAVDAADHRVPAPPVGTSVGVTQAGPREAG
jgi:hypothetical protein